MIVYWLLDLTIDGTLYRLAEVDLDVVRDDGTVLHYDGGLEVQPVTEAISLLSASTTQPEAQVRIWPPHGLSTLSVLRARGELARWVEGTTWERRRRVLVGTCQSPEMESPEEGIVTTIAQDAWRDSSTMISKMQEITKATWVTTYTTLPDATSGMTTTTTWGTYPIIIGRPGRIPAGSSGGDEVQIPAMVTLWADHLGTPAVDADSIDGYKRLALLLAGHHISATKVWLTTETDTIGAWFHVLNTWDDVGQAIAAVPFFYSSDKVPNDLYGDGYPFHLASNATPTPGFANDVFGLGHPNLAPAYNVDTAVPSIYASFPLARSGVANGDPSDSGGLVVAGVTIRSAGDVLAWALSQSSASLDRASMAAGIAALQAYQIDTVIAVRDESGPWDWVTKVLLPILPCSLASGPDGLYVIPLMLDATAADAVAQLDTRRPDVDALKLSWDTSRQVRSVTVGFKYNVKTGAYTDRAIYTSASVAAADTTGMSKAHPSLTLAETWARSAKAQPAEDLVVQTGAIYDAATADLVAYTLARVRALPIGRVVFDVPESDPTFFALRRGSVVYCYDEVLGIDRLGQVESIETPGDGSLQVGVMFLLDPARGSLA